MPDSPSLSPTYKLMTTYGPAASIKLPMDFSGTDAPVLVVKRIWASSNLILNAFWPEIFNLNTVF